MLSKIKEELEKYNESYKSGMMMSMKESIEAESYCNMLLKKIDEIDKLNISEEEKINMLQAYAAGIDDETVDYKYNLYDMLEVINQDSEKKR